jgi:hypothetical protein
MSGDSLRAIRRAIRCGQYLVPGVNRCVVRRVVSRHGNWRRGSRCKVARLGDYNGCWYVKRWWHVSRHLLDGDRLLHWHGADDWAVGCPQSEQPSPFGLVTNHNGLVGLDRCHGGLPISMVTGQRCDTCANHYGESCSRNAHLHRFVPPPVRLTMRSTHNAIDTIPC